MTVISSHPPFYLLRCDKGEEVWDSLLTFCKEQQITAATFSAIGAIGKVTLSFYNLPEKSYEDHTVTEDLEILTITGNVALLDTTHIIHAHGSFAKRDLSVIGGHIKSLTVSATCEITVHVLPEPIERAYDPETGLNLLK